ETGRSWLSGSSLSLVSPPSSLPPTYSRLPTAAFRTERQLGSLVSRASAGAALAHGGSVSAPPCGANRVHPVPMRWIGRVFPPSESDPDWRRLSPRVSLYHSVQLEADLRRIGSRSRSGQNRS